MASTASITFLPCIRLCSTAEINFYFYASWTIVDICQFVSSVSRSLRQDAPEPTLSGIFKISIEHQCQNTCSKSCNSLKTNNARQIMHLNFSEKCQNIKAQCTSQFIFNFVLAPCLVCGACFVLEILKWKLVQVEFEENFVGSGLMHLLNAFPLVEVVVVLILIKNTRTPSSKKMHPI